MTQNIADIETPSELASDTAEVAPTANYSTDLRQLRVDAFDRPGDAETWRALGRALRSKGDRSGAVAAFGRSVAASLADAGFANIEGLIRTGQVFEARRSLADSMKSHADDIVALRLVADLDAGTGNLVEAERLYRRCIDLCPSYLAARHGLSRLLLLQARLGEASNETERMLAAAPTDPGVRTLKAAVAASVGNHEDAVTLYRGLVGELPEQAAPWLGLGHSERTIGRYQEAVAAYRHALEIPGGAAEAYWSLSNLKTYRFDDADIDRMNGLVAGATGQQATYLHFALGAAYDERGHSDRAFEAFARGNAEKRTAIDYDPTIAAQRLRHWTGSITTDLLTARAGEGDLSSAPIFVVGLPRSGSTLVEQILGSHSLIENTAELPYMNRIASQLARRGLESGRERANLNVHGVDLGALGRSYISAAQAHRKTAKPFFVDKLPGNFAHVGLLRLMLPNARIIDVRRHPIATTWSVFKQLFAHGQPFAYDLSEIAQWYRGYVAAMAGFDEVMPGSVFRVHYERLVDDTEREIHRLLDHVGVAFESGCLSFHASGNAVRTPSSEQVRRPIFRSALDDWRRYRSHLSAVEADLASEVAKYPAFVAT